jgi:hypothetical protein
MASAIAPDVQGRGHLGATSNFAGPHVDAIPDLLLNVRTARISEIRVPARSAGIDR